jgi:hypothetical protein
MEVFFKLSWRTSENPLYANFSERRLGEVDLSPGLPAQDQIIRAPLGGADRSRVRKRARPRIAKEGPSGRMGRTTVLLTPTIVSTRYQAHRPDGLSSYAKPALLLTNFGEYPFYALR